MVTPKLKLGGCRCGQIQLLLLSGGAAHWYRAVRVGAAAYVLVEHFCKIGAPFTGVVVVAVVNIEVMGHLANEGTVGVQAD